jgi:hypothetical protein
MNLDSLDIFKKQLEKHAIFKRMNSLDELRVFMEHHVYAVWDFMSLLKKLQIVMVPSGSPWLPGPNGNVIRFINEIVMEEESDQLPSTLDSPEYTSHFEIYLNAMQEVGASTLNINKFLEIVRQDGITKALNWPSLPEPARKFMIHTFDLIEKGKPHEIASSFAIGRESVVPVMFNRILDETSLASDLIPVFRYYLERHTELDGDHHGPMAHQLLENMCSGNPDMEREIIQQAETSMLQRIEFWDGVLKALP